MLLCPSAIISSHVLPDRIVVSGMMGGAASQGVQTPRERTRMVQGIATRVPRESRAAHSLWQLGPCLVYLFLSPRSNYLCCGVERRVFAKPTLQGIYTSVLQSRDPRCQFGPHKNDKQKKQSQCKNMVNLLKALPYSSFSKLQKCLCQIACDASTVDNCQVQTARRPAAGGRGWL